MTFGTGSAEYINGDLTAAPAAPAIAVFWDDLFTSASGVKWEVRGASPARRLIVEWQNVRYYDGAATTLLFQAVLFEGSNQIRFNYSNLATATAGHDNGASATVGVKDATGATRLVLANDNGPNAFVGNSKSTVLTPGSGLGIPDYYSFSATAGQTVSLAVNALPSGNANVSLFASDGTTLLASGSGGPTNFNNFIANFPIITGGIYYAVVSGSLDQAYAMSVATNAAIDAEPNTTAATAQPLGASRGIYGHVIGGAAAVAYNFESGLAGWTINNTVLGTGLWALSTRRGAEAGHSSTTSFYYGQEIAGTYDNGAANAGSITSPQFVVGSADVFNFNYVLRTESSTSFDTADVQITTDGGSNWTTLIGRSTGLANTATWAPVSLSLASYSGQTAKVRFLFNTVDLTANAFEGWYVDDVTIGGSANEDWYSITVPAGQSAIRLESMTPSDGAGQFPNTLDPVIRLYNAAGTTLLGSGVPLPDGRNESLTVNGLTSGSTYLVRVSAASSTSGEYFLGLSTNNNLAPKVSGVVVNASDPQRSRVTTVTIAFDQHVIISGPPEAAFELKRQGDNALPTLAAVVDDSGAVTVVTLTFSGTTAVDFGSLADGRYTLTAKAALVSGPGGQLDGDGNGTGGDNYTMVGTPANGLFRFFGDADGDGTVATNDLIQFRLALGGTNPYFDFDNDAAVAASDFIQFRLRFGGTI